MDRDDDQAARDELEGENRKRYQPPPKGARKPKADSNGDTATLGGVITEYSIARQFGTRYCDLVRFDRDTGRWYLWDGQRWAKDRLGVTLERCGELCQEFGLLGSAKLAKELGKSSTIRGVEFLARSDQRLAITADQWDRDPYLLGTPGGTVDLRDGVLRPAKREDLITKQTAVAPAPGKCPVFMRFLKEITRNDQQLIDYLQVVFGYILTGLTIEQVLFFAHGPGGNGKTVLIVNTIAPILGDYATTAPMETFTVGEFAQHPTDLAGLKGARLVTAIETEEGRQWAEARIKQITGGDTIAARFMRQDFFEYDPEFKLFILGNHKPALKHVDDATRRRFRLIPFTYKPPTVDLRLKDRLREEWPQILHWMIQGAVKWGAKGLPEATAVKEETEQYFYEQDPIRQWLDEKCDVDPPRTPEAMIGRCRSSQLYASWCNWCGRNDAVAGSNVKFSKELGKRGFKKKETAAANEFLGLTFKRVAKGAE